MKPTLLKKFLLGYLVFAVLSFAAIATLSYWLIYRNCLAQSARELRTQTNSIAYECGAVYQGSDSSDILFSNISWYANLDGRTVWILDADGVISYDSDARHEGTVISDFDPTASSSYYTTGNLSGLFSEDQLTTFSPITGNFTTYGYVLIMLPVSEIAASANSMMVPFYISLGIVLAFSLIIILLYVLWVSAPLKKITKAAQEYAEGNLQYKLEIKSNDELGYLGKTLNYMASELSKSEEYQRQFISNVSHDFRSPLTSIKGYLVAMKDGVITPDMQGKYLDIIINETDRLTGLTQNMLKLNSLNSGTIAMEYSDFDVNAVIKATCSTFEGRCRSHEIDFDLYFQDPSTFVHADKGKIQQVIYNLVDNAIKFSPDGSTITLETFEKRGKIFVSVKDHGCGIAKENIKKIWVRFYKSDESRGKDKKGTGLGLAIVKEIIQAHNENIDVISTEGAGTEFIFSLQKSEDPDEL